MQDETYAISGRLLLRGQLVEGTVVVRGGTIDAIVREPSRGDVPKSTISASIVAPGLIDLQVNGGFGVEVGGDPTVIRTLASRLSETGVTAFLPTLISSPAAAYPPAIAAFQAARGAPGATPLGLHLEGPFLSPKRPGAHRQDVIEAGDDHLFRELVAADAVRLMTLAPETPGAIERIRRARESGVTVSLGHTEATYDEFGAGVDAGATMATHLYSAMSAFGHRAPGAAGAALVDDRVTVGLIADGIHAHPAAIRLACRAKGSEGVALVSDMMTAAGMPPGSYALGGRPVTVDTTSARLADGTLAGSILTLDQAVRNVIAWAGVEPASAIRMASEVPARVLGLCDRGTIAPGLAADLTLFDHDLAVVATIVNGGDRLPAAPRAVSINRRLTARARLSDWLGADRTTVARAGAYTAPRWMFDAVQLMCQSRGARGCARPSPIVRSFHDDDRCYPSLTKTPRSVPARSAAGMSTTRGPSGLSVTVNRVSLSSSNSRSPSSATVAAS